MLTETNMCRHRNLTNCHQSPVHTTRVPEFPLYFGIEIQGLSRTLKLHFQGPILDEVYSMENITAIFRIYFCDYGTVLVDKNKT